MRPSPSHTLRSNFKVIRCYLQVLDVVLAEMVVAKGAEVTHYPDRKALPGEISTQQDSKSSTVALL